ncbi:uncharacterized protein LOC129905824 [Episyrphus balteatus]|uniref:uncharacterized protein LOC129905824 n=1 Tax=Episyrphus balteatus TaxID=286459 RepID=UPI00248699B3|nr:uncharacterized protein LOC129905824 [Episyrphus balteatus]
MDIFQKLAEADILDIYDEIAEIPITNEQVIKHCMTVPCKVDLRRCNLVYLVEQKYKDKLSTYKKSKKLKWLKVNIPRLFSNPQAKYLAWQERSQRKYKIEWLTRKAEAIEPLPPLINGSSDSECNSPKVVIINDTQMTAQSNTSADNTFATVIPSQPKSTEILPGFSGLLNASRSLEESFELPPIFSNSVSSTQRNEGDHRRSPSPGIRNKPERYNETPKNTTRLPMIQRQSEGFSSQEDQYTLFNLENMVTSTQEFG